jgi:adenosylhomocysteine nucleosidase
VQRIAILGALDREIRGIRRALDNPRKISIPGLMGWSGFIGSREVFLVQTGIGPISAGSAAEKVLTKISPQAILSVGFACALRSKILIGDIILSVAMAQSSPDGTLIGRVLENHFISFKSLSGYPFHELDSLVDPKGSLAFLGKEKGFNVYTGLILTLDHMVQKAQDKKILAKQTHAVALDMESAVIGEKAKGFQIPFLALRGISDLLDEDLEVEFDRIIHPDGSFRFWSGVPYLFSHPLTFFELYRLKQQTQLASKNLTCLVFRLLQTQEDLI